MRTKLFKLICIMYMFQEFNMRSSVMIEGAPSAVMNEIIEENLTELDAGTINNYFKN